MAELTGLTGLAGLVGLAGLTGLAGLAKVGGSATLGQGLAGTGPGMPIFQATSAALGPGMAGRWSGDADLQATAALGQGMISKLLRDHDCVAHASSLQIISFSSHFSARFNPIRQANVLWVYLPVLPFVHRPSPIIPIPSCPKLQSSGPSEICMHPGCEERSVRRGVIHAHLAWNTPSRRESR